ncbi:hypothetical protein BKI52_03290 [marine bacterium AO1-C]|nr:hypothetical protein BKI52_03290 [marine bacterium AO1-C]
MKKLLSQYICQQTWRRTLLLRLLCLFGVFVWLGNISSIQAQAINGPTVVNNGETHTFQYIVSHNSPFISWSTSHTGVTISSTSSNKRYASVSFASNLTSGTYKVIVTDRFLNFRNPVITEYSVQINALPATPNALVQFSQTGCVAGQLAYATTPPSGITWYWQTTANGTSTTSSAALFSVSEASAGNYTYYLRAFANGQWSAQAQAISVTYTTGFAPPFVQSQQYDPTTQTYYLYACEGGSIDLSQAATNTSPLTGVPDLPGQITWFEAGQSVALTNLQTPVLTLGQTKNYEVANYNATTQCAGERRKVVVQYQAPPLASSTLYRPVIAGNGSVVIPVQADVIAWYADGATTQLLATGNELDTDALATQQAIYYLKTEQTTGSGPNGSYTCGGITPVEVARFPRPTLNYHATFSNLDDFGGFVVKVTNAHAYNAGQNVQYQWYKNGTIITGANQSEYTVTSAGDYTVKVTLAHAQDPSQIASGFSESVNPYGEHPPQTTFIKPVLNSLSTSIQASQQGCGQLTLTLVDEFPQVSYPVKVSDEVIWYWQKNTVNPTLDHPAFGRDAQGQIITNANGQPKGEPYAFTGGMIYLRAYDPVNQVWSESLNVGTFPILNAPPTPALEPLTAYCLGDAVFITTINHSDYIVEWYRNDQVSSGQVNAGEIPIQVGMTLEAGTIAQTSTFWVRFRVDHSSAATCYSPLVAQQVEILTDCDTRYNLIKTQTVRTRGVVDLEAVEALSVPQAEVARVTNYFDGMSRLIQTVNHQISPTIGDRVQAVVYDGFGRTTQQHLPYTVVNSLKPGDFRTDAINEQKNFYQTTPNVVHSNYTYSLQRVEASPLNRTTETLAPGEHWIGNNKGTNTTFLVNPDPNQVGTATQDKIRFLHIDLKNTPDVPLVGVYYASGDLIFQRTVDEDGKAVEEYTNKSGQVILKRAKVDATTWAETYYVYDNLSRVGFVLPPEATKLLTQANWIMNTTLIAQLKKLWFHYKYDARGRIIEKHIPGTGKIEMVYDNRDRLVLTQDAQQHLRDEWTFIKYDYLNRPVITGLHINLEDRATLQANLDTHFGQVGYQVFEQFDLNQTANHYYTNQTFPNSQLEVLSVTYYDNYAWKNGNTAYNYQMDYQVLATDPITHEVIGQVTATKLKILDDQASSASYLTTANYYDERGRIIQIIGDNHQGGHDIVSTQYAFDGRVLQTVKKHVIVNPLRTYHIYQWNEYDQAARVKATYQEVTASANFIYKDLATAKTTPSVEKLSKVTYNELGQLLSKKLGEKASNPQQPLQTLNYRYNIQGWITHVNDAALSTQSTDGDIFGFELKYAQGGANAYLNGNIAQMAWQSSLDGVQRKYDYTYDGLDRLIAADYSDNDVSVTGTTKPNFDVPTITYDLNGNILSLQRYGLQKQTADLQKTFGLIDQLTYNYEGNRLMGVDDATNPATVTGVAKDFRDGHNYATQGQEYFYDENGNLNQDKNKNITSIAYNHLNLPTEIVFNNNRSIRYVYDAAGIKLQKIINDAGTLTTTDYLGNFIYENDELQFLHTTEGRILGPGQLGDNPNFVYEYHYKDHLGNLRVAFREGTANTTQATIEDRSVDLQQGFAYEPEVRATKPTGGGHAAKLGKDTQLLGPWKTLPVTKGDQVSAEVYAHINGTPNQGNALPIQVFVANLANVYNQNGETNVNNPNLLQLGVSFSPNGQTSQSPGLPVAYLRYVFYNDQGAAVKSGRFFVTTLAQGGWERLQFDLKVPENGTLQIYTANETETQNVWFDDLKVTFTPQLIVQENHYYPFGMNLAGIEKQGRPNHKFQYNGKEFEEETGYLDYHARRQDPQLGRFISIDPHAESYLSYSPFAYVGNNPVKITDPDGKDWFVDATGNVLWADTDADTYIDDHKNAYSNIGESMVVETNGVYYLFGNSTKVVAIFDSNDESVVTIEGEDMTDADFGFQFNGSGTDNNDENLRYSNNIIEIFEGFLDLLSAMAQEPNDKMPTPAELVKKARAKSKQIAVSEIAKRNGTKQEKQEKKSKQASEYPTEAPLLDGQFGQHPVVDLDSLTIIMHQAVNGAALKYDTIQSQKFQKERKRKEKKEKKQQKKNK